MADMEIFIASWIFTGISLLFGLLCIFADVQEEKASMNYNGIRSRMSAQNAIRLRRTSYLAFIISCLIAIFLPYAFPYNDFSLMASSPSFYLLAILLFIVLYSVRALYAVSRNKRRISELVDVYNKGEADSETIMQHLFPIWKQAIQHGNWRAKSMINQLSLRDDKLGSLVRQQIKELEISYGAK